jgi:hypothetical protein
MKGAKNAGQAKRTFRRAQEGLELGGFRREKTSLLRAINISMRRADIYYREYYGQSMWRRE